MNIMKALEPIHLSRDTTLFAEQDEITEVYFLMSGIWDIGFSVNLEQFFKMRYEHYSVIGAYGVTFFKRSAYIYKTVTECKGYFIRRQRWKVIMDSNDSRIIKEFQNVILKEFE